MNVHDPASTVHTPPESSGGNTTARKRKRCDNCGTFTPKTHPKKRFCCDECRFEYHRNGGMSTMAQRELITKLTRQLFEAERPRIVADLYALIKKEQAPPSERLQLVTNRLRTLLDELER